jgi:hypothetical protein
VVAALLVASSPVHASTLWDDGLVRLSDLEAGAVFESENGMFSFSDFDFTAVGFDDSALDDYLVAPRDDGFRLLLGFGSPFGPAAALEMTYKVTTIGPFDLSGASIPFLAVFEAFGGTPLAEVNWMASNGATMSTSTSSGGFLDDVSTSFAPVGMLMVEQVVSMSGAEAIVKVENAFQKVERVPEPGTGAMIAIAGVTAWFVTRRRPAK